MTELIRLAEILTAAHNDHRRLSTARWPNGMASSEEWQASYARECRALEQFNAAILARLAS
jgi:hypothetical protein